MQSTLRTGVAALLILLFPAAAGQAQQPPPANCAQVAPVCALKNGTRQTYWNTCLAARDAAEFLYPGECRVARSPN
jgi:hypothetical protein